MLCVLTLHNFYISCGPTNRLSICQLIKTTKYRITFFCTLYTTKADLNIWQMVPLPAYFSHFTVLKGFSEVVVCKRHWWRICFTNSGHGIPFNCWDELNQFKETWVFEFCLKLSSLTDHPLKTLVEGFNICIKYWIISFKVCI